MSSPSDNDSIASGRKRRFVISQYPLGTSDTNNVNNMKTVINEIKNMKQSLDVYNTRMAQLEDKVTCVLEKCVGIMEMFSKFENVLKLADSSSKKPCPEQTEAKSILFNNRLVSKESATNKPDYHSLLDVKIVSSIDDKSNISLHSNTATMFTESSQIIKLNSEADYPNGSWLGNPQLPEARVRCALREYDLNNINICSSSAEKMALLLMDNLFSRETLAESNLTGKGRHKKKQLDPLLIFGIYCHLQFMFNIDEPHWVRIKNNMEAKCRFLWMRKSKGLPLGQPATSKIPIQNAKHIEQEQPEPRTEYTVQLVNDTQYSTGFPMYVGDDDSSRVVTVDTESVYQLETGDFVSGHGQDSDLLSGTLAGVPVLVTANSNIMLAAANTSNNEEEEED